MERGKTDSQSDSLVSPPIDYVWKAAYKENFVLDKHTTVFQRYTPYRCGKGYEQNTCVCSDRTCTEVPAGTELVNFTWVFFFGHSGVRSKEEKTDKVATQGAEVTATLRII